MIPPNENASEPESNDPPQPEPETPVTPEAALPAAEAERRIRALSRRSFLQGAVAVAGLFGGWKWLLSQKTDDDLLWPLRRVLRANESIARLYFNPGRLAPTFAASFAGEPRPNGDEGLSEEFDPAEWKLKVFGLAGYPSGRSFTLEGIRSLPKTEMVTELKCIEGWSRIVRWGGARLLDFAERYPPATRSGQKADLINRRDDVPEYVGMETPDGGYYVGLDLDSALHPQTLLCYEMNGEPLTPDHGAPLRLVIPVKYGIKNIKRIGTIRFASDRPADFWAEQGYDWYAGH
jgi:DMSO/TMAO reductase YedYZ molybdopterin-dependent catalytic subunit